MQFIEFYQKMVNKKAFNREELAYAKELILTSQAASIRLEDIDDNIY